MARKAKKTKQTARWDRNRSPVDWYVGSYLLRFIEIGAKGNYDPKRKFLSWENTVLVKAKSLDQAHAKITKIARAAAMPYRGGPDGIPVKWVFEGITELLPVYEEIEDGAEIMWAERASKSLKALRQWVRSKRAFAQLRSIDRHEQP